MANFKNEHFIRFFFLTLVDEVRVIEASNEAMIEYNKATKGKPEADFQSLHHQEFVKSTFSNWKKKQRPLDLKGVEIQTQVLSAAFAHVIQPWKNTLKLSRSDEFLAVLWGQVFGISDEDIANALRISVGTVRYRISRGLKKVGQQAQLVQFQ